MEKIRERIYLASLLHDIGKFYQRADEGSVRNSIYLRDLCKDESLFCPSTAGKYTHKHVLWTAQFIEDNIAAFKNLLWEDSGLFSVGGNNLMYLAAGHHLPTELLSDLGRIIKEADCLSSGMDRNSDEALKDAAEETTTNWNAFQKKRMVSVLETIDIYNDDDDANAKQVYMHLPVDKLHLSKELFPRSSFSSAPDYSRLWNEFVREFKFIQADTHVAFAESLLALLFKYTGYIPSSTINFPDVSLYDHLKTTAALAVCLYDYQQCELHDKEQCPFLLIGADFSGIQSYIYQIVSKYAGKNLKGRSFYLNILSDAVVRYLLNELHLFQANIVYNSGGGFYLIAPNTPFHQNQLKKCIAVIEEHFFKVHGTSLYVAIDAVELSKDALMHRNGEDLGKVWGSLFVKRDRKKMAKFAKQIEANYDSLFNPIMQGGEAQRDTITGEEFAASETICKRGSLTLKPLTAIQIDLGEKLRDTDLLVIKKGDLLDYWKDKVHITPADLGFTYYLLKESDVLQMKDKLRSAADNIMLLTLNGKEEDCNFMHSMECTYNIYGLEFYSGNEMGADRVTTFEEMCENPNFSRMGVLRMDVDNLGNIFQKGLPANRATLSRLAALSRSFDFFFSGYLNTIWKEIEPERSFIVYSGGDDVFIVGRWDVAIQLAERIRNDFRAYTCNNPSFSLSGGIAVIPPKFPIMKGAEESAVEEQRAKSHRVFLSNGKPKEKNSLSFLGTPLNWDHEYQPVKALKDELCALLHEDKLPKSFLAKIMRHYANAGIKKHRITQLKTYWMLTYDLNRMKERFVPEVANLIDCCIKEVCDKTRKTLNGRPLETNYHALELWNFAARWAELEYRSNTNV